MRRLAYIALLWSVLACTSSRTGAPDSPPCADGYLPGPLGVGCVRDCSRVTNCGSDIECEDGFCALVEGCRVCSPEHQACIDPTTVEVRTCRSPSDCCGPSVCMSSGDSFCGACMRSNQECDTQTPCSDGLVCIEIPPTRCSCDGLPSHVCRVSCAETGCAEDEICGTDGACRDRLCTDGFVCPFNRRCDASSPAPHGCAPIDCQRDRDCPKGAFCVNHACESALGSCSLGIP